VEPDAMLAQVQQTVAPPRLAPRQDAPQTDVPINTQRSARESA
jgi:hypothetical protein